MSRTPADTPSLKDLLAAAREKIRDEGHLGVIGIYRLLDELLIELGDCFTVSPETYKILHMVEALWADPVVDQVPNTGEIEFAWREEEFDSEVSRNVPELFEGLRARMRRYAQSLPPTSRHEVLMGPADLAEACVNLVRDSGATGVIFPMLADLIGRSLNTFGDETVLLDADHSNIVCWNQMSREFLAAINTVRQHPNIRMVRTTPERYYDDGEFLEIFPGPDGSYGPLMPPIEGDIAEGGYATPHWLPVAFVWNAEPHRPGHERG
jgi:hypothetical protein